MNNKSLKLQKPAFIFLVLCFLFTSCFAQYKSFELSDRGDTLNATDKKDQKQGKWVIHVAALRGEPGYEEEGVFKNDKKEGIWRRYSLSGDIVGVERYKFGGKDGAQQYFTPMGDIIREESWKAYNPDAPYDTIPVYGTGNNEILKYKIVKAEQYSVKNGSWRFYDPTTGRVVRSETYDRGVLVPQQDNTVANEDNPKLKVKPKEVLDFEKQNSGKKKVKLREGQTGL